MFRFSIFFRSHRYSTAVNPISGDRKPRKPRKPPNFIVDYLINSLQFTKQDAITVSSKGNLTHLKSSTNSNSIINVFKNYGLNNTQIKEIVYSVPKILTCKANKTLEPKIRVFHELGVSGSDLVNLVKKSPCIFEYGLHTRIIPGLNYLRKLFGNDEKFLLYVINKSKCLYFTDTWLRKVAENVAVLKSFGPFGLLNENSVKFLLSRPERLRKISVKISLLKRYGLSHEKIVKILFDNPKRMRGTLKVFETKMRFLEEKLGISRHSPNFVLGLIAIMYRSESVIERKREVFRDFGWSDYEIATLIRVQPFVLNQSDACITEKLKFFMKDLNYDPSYLICCTNLWTLSLEKRVKPRNEILKILNKKELLKGGLSLITIVKYSEPKFVCFLRRFDTHIQPSLYETYMNCIKNLKTE